MNKIAYHNDPEQKAQHVARANWHKEQDMIAQGAYYMATGETYIVCAIACSLPKDALARMNQGDPHKVQSEYTGIHPMLSRLHHKMFEGAAEGCEEFAPRVFETLKAGADTERIAWTFVYELLGSELTQKHVQGDKFKQQRDAIEMVRNVYEDALRTGVINKAAAREAGHNAYHAAAYSAARAAFDVGRSADAAAYAAAGVASDVYDTAVDAAACVYATADAAAYVHDAVYIEMREILLNIQANWDVETQTYIP